MSDLLTQLREYGHQLDSRTTPLEDLTPAGPVPTRPGIGWRGPLVALGTAAAIAVVAIATAFLLRGPEAADPASPADESPATTVAATTTLLETSEPTGVFSWDGDDLGNWLTEPEMTGLLTETMALERQAVLEGEVVLVHSEGDADWTWTFRTVDEPGTWRIIVHNGDHGPERGRVDPTATDPRLPTGVTYERLSGFAHGFYGLSGPDSNETICMAIFPPGEGFGYPAGSETTTHEAVLFPLASWMLQEMGWVESLEDALPRAEADTEPVPIMETKQILYGAGDISCPEHWAHDQSLPVGSVEFEAGRGMFAVVVELVAAAPHAEYEVEVWEPETCLYGGPLLFEAAAPRVLTTGETGSGRIEFTVEDVDPGTYRLNVNVVHNGWEGTFPDAEDKRLREIGGAGFSLVEVP